LDACASQDAAAAMHIAEVCNISLPTAFPEIVIKNCDQMPFLALVKEQLVKDKERQFLWASLVTEAGLRSTLVPRTLPRMPADANLSAAVRGVPRRKLWCSPWQMSDTYYTQVLTLSTTGDTPVVLPMLSVLAQCPPPGRFRITTRIARVMPLVVALPSMVGLAIADSS